MTTEKNVQEIANILFRHKQALKKQEELNQDLSDLLNACSDNINTLNMLPVQTKTTIAGTIASECKTISDQVLAKINEDVNNLSTKVNSIKHDIDRISLFNKGDLARFLITCFLVLGLGSFAGSWFFWKKFPPQSWVNVQKIDTLHCKEAYVKEPFLKKK